jgi:pSer/pThr/pTyr-binding forkhead associated (FHA) protein
LVAEQSEEMTELKLVVLAGAKEGTQIPLKKSKFIIGRSSECTLRAASDAISRRHCAILRTKDAWVARDLGSRNGTFLNDERIENPTPLSVGDELRIGPLKFRVDQSDKPPTDAKSAETDRSTKSDLPPDMPRSTKPAKDARGPQIGDGSATEEDISGWLIGALDMTENNVTRETQALSMDDTTAISRRKANKQTVEIDDAEDIAIVDDDVPTAAAAAGESSINKQVEGNGSGGWSLFGKGKNKNKPAKKSPGKLPKRPDQESKDSREAAADILREMTRRR